VIGNPLGGLRGKTKGKAREKKRLSKKVNYKNLLQNGLVKKGELTSDIRMARRESKESPS